MNKKINLFLLINIIIFSFVFFIAPTSASTITPTKKVQTVKKPVIVKKPVVTKKVIKKVTKPVKKVVVKNAPTKNIPMNQLPNPNSAGSDAMKIYLQTINDARLIFKKEQTSAKTKEAKQAAEDKYSQSVQEAMDVLSASKTNTSTNATKNTSSTNQ